MKKKNLPDDLQMLIDSRDMAAFAAVFKKCEITATETGKTTSNAFSYRNLSAEQVQFLIDKGLNPNSDCGYGYSAVAKQALNEEALDCLLRNGADINYKAVSYRGNALAIACIKLNPGAVGNLLERNASVAIADKSNGKPVLDSVLINCYNYDIPNALAICNMLLQAGASPSGETPKYVEEIGKRFDFYRSGINPDAVDELSGALDGLYELFHVMPVPKRDEGICTEETKPKADRWQDEFEELWQELVPATGRAETVQGEVVRIVGKITYELLDNGGINWDSEYRKLVKALAGYLKQNEQLDPVLAGEACRLAKGITRNSGKTELYRLTELVVEWVAANPEPKTLGDVNYVR